MAHACNYSTPWRGWRIRSSRQPSATWHAGGQHELRGNLCQEQNQRKIKEKIVSSCMPMAALGTLGLVSIDLHTGALSGVSSIDLHTSTLSGISEHWFSCKFPFHLFHLFFLLLKTVLLFVCTCVDIRQKLRSQLSLHCGIQGLNSGCQPFGPVLYIL